MTYIQKITDPWVTSPASVLSQMFDIDFNKVTCTYIWKFDNFP